jgi:hypothetical protein
MKRRAFLGIALAAVSATAEGQTREGGVTWNTVLDNDTVTVTRVHMPPGTAGNNAGFVQFLPRNVSHAYANADVKPFELLSVSIK